MLHFATVRILFTNILILISKDCWGVLGISSEGCWRVYNCVKRFRNFVQLSSWTCHLRNFYVLWLSFVLGRVIEMGKWSLKSRSSSGFQKNFWALEGVQEIRSMEGKVPLETVKCVFSPVFSKKNVVFYLKFVCDVATVVCCLWSPQVDLSIKIS